MKEKEIQESANSIIQRLIKDRRLTEENYVSSNKDKYKTAEARRINDFTKLLTDGKKEGK